MTFYGNNSGGHSANLLKNAEHGTLTHRTMASLKGIVDGQILNGGLKQSELIGDKRIAVGKMPRRTESAKVVSTIKELQKKQAGKVVKMHK